LDAKNTNDTRSSEVDLRELPDFAQQCRGFSSKQLLSTAENETTPAQSASFEVAHFRPGGSTNPMPVA
jgi:hypothetical protein